MNAAVDAFAIDLVAARESEQAILGGLLTRPSLWDVVGDMLAADDFYSEQNGKIFTAASGLILSAKDCDAITVMDAMDREVDLVYLTKLCAYTPSPANMRKHAEIVRERSLSRKLMAAGSSIVDLAQDHAQPIGERVDQATAALAKLLPDAPRDEWVHVQDGMTLHMDVLEARSEGKHGAMPTGLTDLDEYLEGGLRPGELVIVGARPSMGKTALGLTIGAAMAERYTVGLLSMEMSHAEVNDRLTAMLGVVSLSEVKRPRRDKDEFWNRVVDGVERARTLRLHTSDQGGLNINQVRSKARNLKRAHGLHVLVVDYIGLMSGLDAKANRNTQLEEISRGLKALAKELQICVLCLAQLNRKSEERPDQMPMMSDLRDSGAIEQDADVIVFIKRPIMANPDLGPEWQHYAKLSVAKNRQGRCGFLHLSYLGEQTKFSGWSGQPPFKSVGRGSGKFE